MCASFFGGLARDSRKELGTILNVVMEYIMLQW